MSFFDITKLDKFSKDPGVYLMKNRHDEVIYVGKAKSLRNRIKQYFSPGGDGRPMIPFLTAEVVTIDTIIAFNEKEALLLENTLIKKHKPKFNALLKDDKSFINLMINHKHKWPMIRLVRFKGKKTENNLYFGPYTKALAARETFEVLARVFPLRQCSDSELTRRTRPCILYSIKRCLAPCVGKCSESEYKTFVQSAISFLQGHDKKIIPGLYKEMKKASEALEYEKAAALHKTIMQLEHITEKKGLLDRSGGTDCDALGIYREGQEVILVQLIFRGGKLIASESYPFSEVAQTDEELFSSFLLQYYQNQKDLPEEVLLPVALEESSLLKEIIKCSVLCPKIGTKKAFVDLAKKNAQATFTKEKDQNAIKEKMLLDLQETLHLTQYPEIIESFDISNIAGTDSVGAMAVFKGGSPDRSRRRLFKIQGVQNGDDYGALAQVLTRRIKRGRIEGDLPNLIMVDGGKGHLSTAIDVFKMLNVKNIDLISIAKEESRHDRGMTKERIFHPLYPEPFELDYRSPLLFLLQKIRDQTHDMAIEFHRKKRSERIISSDLSALPGIGPIKTRRLLQHFGSVRGIKEASEAKWAEVKGINKNDIITLKNISKN